MNVEWINIKDRLPEENTRIYLVCFNNGTIALAYSLPTEYEDGSFSHSNIAGKYGSRNEVSFLEDIAYWMPIPFLPINKGEQ